MLILAMILLSLVSLNRSQTGITSNTILPQRRLATFAAGTTKASSGGGKNLRGKTKTKTLMKNLDPKTVQYKAGAAAAAAIEAQGTKTVNKNKKSAKKHLFLKPSKREAIKNKIQASSMAKKKNAKKIPVAPKKTVQKT